MTARPYFWQDFALCAETDPEIFFPPRGEPGLDAIKICNQCPVRNECLEAALHHWEQIGIRGGLTVNARKRIFRARRQAKRQEREAA